MDAVDCAVFRVTMEEGASKIAAPLSRVDRHRICHDLGYKPSSLLQANSLIWVEGPSDRLYILNWLKAIDATLEEGWHFSIMFYGGRLLSHLSGEDRLLDDFIALLPINRFPALLIDSDRKSEGSRINTTKARLRDELANVGGSIWITKGREIENYISRSVRESVVQALYGQDCKLIDADDTFGDPLSFSQGGTAYTKPVDKLAIARDASRLPTDLTVLDLEKELRRLARFIRAANRMPD
jgi:hypothetical protein